MTQDLVVQAQVESALIIDLVDQGRRALAEAKTVWQTRVVREKAAAIKDLARRQKRLLDSQSARQRFEEPQAVRSGALDSELDAAELWIDAYRQEGTLLRELQDADDRADVGRPEKWSQAVTISGLGYDHKMEAKRAVDVSIIPEGIVDDYKLRQRDKREPCTMAGLVRYWADLLKQRDVLDMPLPTGIFRTLVIDPPWPMGKSVLKDEPEQGSKLDYPTMSIEEIGRKLDGWVPAHAAEAAHVYLWVTQRFLPDGLEFVKRWGFRYHCLLTWLKPGGFAPFSWMFNTEHVVFAYRGDFQLRALGINIGFQAPRGEHSQKPEAFYEMVERASFEPWVELFARRGRENWSVWGDEM